MKNIKYPLPKRIKLPNIIVEPILLLIGLFLSVNSFAFQTVDLPTIFPNVAQGHNVSGSCPQPQLRISSGEVEINGTKGEALNFCSRLIESGDSTRNCDSADGTAKSRTCDITNNMIQALDLTSEENAFKPIDESAHVVNVTSCTGSENVVVGEGAYDVTEIGDISIYSSCSITFSANHNEYRIKKLEMGNGATIVLTPGKYYFENVSLNYGAKIELQGEEDIRLFIHDSLTLNADIDFNADNSSPLQMVIYNNLMMNGGQLGGLIYVNGHAEVNTGSVLNGRITANELIVRGKINNTISLDDNSYKGPLQFGKTDKALSGSVTFDIPFDKVPKVFLMPTIEPDGTEYNETDGPATLTLTSVTKTGFTWIAEQPIYSKYGYRCDAATTCQTPPKPMEVHWLAATEGTHTLSDGKEIIVGSVPFSQKALGMAKIDDRKNNPNREPRSWVKVDTDLIPASHSVILNSRQVKANNCFLTSIALPIDNYSGLGNRTGTYFMLDTSNATVSGRAQNLTVPTNCLPPLSDGMDETNSGIENLATEEIAYLATTPGVGEFEDIDKTIVRYQFGSANTDASSAVINSRIEEQVISFTDTNKDILCSKKTSFATSFEDIPTFVAGKVSANNDFYSNDTVDEVDATGPGVYILRNDYSGGFLRRCNLTKTDVSMVTDESYTHPKNPRKPFPERYAFVALEKASPPPTSTCFTDEFDRTKIGEDWLTYVASGSTIGMADGKLRLTEAISNQATATTYQRLFPIIDNIIEVEFDYYSYLSKPNNSYGKVSGDGVALVFSDSTITPKVGAPGAGLGYTSGNNIAGFAGGWLAFGLDDFGNFSGAKNRIRATGANPKFNYLGTSATLSSNPLTIAQSGTGPLYGDRYRFVIDSSTDPNQINISVSRRKQTEDTFKPILLDREVVVDIKNTNASITNDLLLSLASSTGGAFATHEIDNFKVCALRSKSMGQLVHHFEFEYSDTPSTCTAEAVKITACRNASCSLIVDEEVVTATLKPTNSDSVTWSGPGVSGNTVTFSGGSTTIYLSNTAVGKITFGVTDSTPGLQAFTSYDGTLCKQGAGSLSSAACTVEFKNTALVLESFDVETADIEGDINGMIANKLRDVIISAYKKKDTEGGDTGEVCEAAPLGTKNIFFWSEYDNPNSSNIIGSPQISVTNNTGTIQSYTIGNSKSKKTSIPIAFDDQGAAKIKINYPDAGKVQLSLELVDVDDKGNSTSYEGSGQFVSFPDGLCLTSPDANSACESNDATCSAFKAAGEAFNLRVQAKAWQTEGDKDFCDNPIVTPNYQQDNIALTHALVKPDGGNLGKLSINEYTHTLGNVTEIPLSISEVGVFTLQAKPPLPYLGSNYHEIGASSASIGRFYPYSFITEVPSISHQCSTFSYMGQPFSGNVLIKALNKNKDVTQNYQGDFVYSTLQLTAENNNNGHSLSDRIDFTGGVNSIRWSKGQLQLNDSIVFNRNTGTDPDGHYPNLAIGLQIFELNTLLENPSINPNTTGDCTANQDEPCNTWLLSDGNDLRYGRVKLENTYGNSHEELQMPAYAEYWNGNRWQINEKDSCTVANNYDYTTTKEGIEIKRYRRENEIISQGKQTLYWKAFPSYQGSVSASLAVPDYLQWYWNGLTLSDPEATATFGTYRGHNRIIYRTEVIRDY